MAQNAVAIRAKRQLFSGVDNVDTFEGGTQCVVGRDFHSDGIIEDDVGRTVGSDMLGEDFDQGLHALRNGALLDTSC